MNITNHNVNYDDSLILNFVFELKFCLANKFFTYLYWLFHLCEMIAFELTSTEEEFDFFLKSSKYTLISTRLYYN